MDSVDLPRILLSFLFIIGLIGVSAMALKYFAVKKKALGILVGGERLQIVETRYIDSKRRMVLVRRDDVEHLLLLSDGKDMLIENTIASLVKDKDTHA